MSVTYSHRTKKKSAKETAKHDGEQPATVNPEAAPAALYVKTYDPVSGTCFRIRVGRSNELSRIWSALGPKSLEVTKQDKTAVERGMSAIMADKEYALSVESTPQATAAASPAQGPVDDNTKKPAAGADKKASKKKGKKR